ncbi:MAG: hypothetical protein AB1540_17335, partial [Bdellovibrionota bacterium]
QETAVSNPDISLPTATGTLISDEINELKRQNKELQKRLVVLEEARAEKKAVPAQAEKKSEPAYDVPDQRISEVAERLKYTNDILKRFGKAYDYRSTTLKEFKRILADLESKEENSKELN